MAPPHRQRVHEGAPVTRRRKSKRAALAHQFNVLLGLNTIASLKRIADERGTRPGTIARELILSGMRGYVDRGTHVLSMWPEDGRKLQVRVPDALFGELARVAADLDIDASSLARDFIAAGLVAN